MKGQVIVKNLISIITPAYNAEQFIEESIQSVLHQTYQIWELIIVDDGSTDNTSQIIKRYTAKDVRIQYFYQQNGKQGKARNFGISKAKGELIAFLDADDLWVPEKLEKQIELLRSAGADLVFSDVTVINEQGVQIKSTRGVRDENFSGEEGLISLLALNKIPLLTVMAKRESLCAVNGFKESNEIQYGEDYELWMRMLQNSYRFASSSEKLGAYRIHSMQSTNNKAAMLGVISTISGIPFADKKMNDQKNKATLLWLKRWLLLNKLLKKEEIQAALSMYPYRVQRPFLFLLYRVSSSAFFHRAFYSLCTIQLKLSKVYN